MSAVELKDTKQIVGIADMKMGRGSGTLVTYALGSCIGICLYDPLVKVGALIHIMLPLNMETGRTHPMKYADSGIRETLKKMESMGAAKMRITAKIAGGAKMFEITGGTFGNIGQRNIESVRMVLKREGIKLLKEDVGGSTARTLLFDVSNGVGCVRCHGKPDLMI